MDMLDRLYSNKNKKDKVDNIGLEEVIAKNAKNESVTTLNFLDNMRSNMTVLGSIILLVIFFIFATLILVSNELRYV